MHPRTERRGVGRQALEPEAELLRALQPAFEMVVRDDGAIDLGAGRQASLHGSARQALGILTGFGSGPGDDHAAKLPGFAARQNENPVAAGPMVSAPAREDFPLDAVGV